jgi:hypothetical protein
MLLFALSSTEGKRFGRNAEEHDGRNEENWHCVAVPTVEGCMAVGYLCSSIVGIPG